MKTIISYRIPQGAAAGRAINALLREIKKTPAEEYHIYGAENATLSGKWQVILRKIKSRFKKRNQWGQGPYRQKNAARLLKRMIRGMMNYKGAQSDVYKKIIVDPETKSVEGIVDLKVKLLLLHERHSLEKIAKAL